MVALTDIKVSGTGAVVGDIPRVALQKLLRPLLPKTWRVVSGPLPDTLSSTMVQIKQLRIERSKAAPRGAHEIEFVVTVTSRIQDQDKAEDELDDSVNALIHAIDGLGIGWSSAVKVLNGPNMAYDITLTLISTKQLGA